MSNRNTVGHAGLFRVIWYLVTASSAVFTKVEPITKEGIRAQLASFSITESELHQAFEAYQLAVSRLDISTELLANNCAVVYCGW